MRIALLLLLVACNGDRQVERIASGLMHCPKVTVRDRSIGDASETYTVEGCGRRETLVCNAPDYECFVAP